jgi:hypothetical protein
MKYKICYADSVTQLEQTVAVFIEQGWAPIGGVACMVAEGRETHRHGWQEPEQWAQAIIHAGDQEGHA